MNNDFSKQLLCGFKLMPVWVLWLAMLLSCQNPLSQDSSLTNQDGSDSTRTMPVETITASLPEAGSVSGDTLNLYGKCVLFMGPKEGSYPENETAHLDLYKNLKENFKTHPELTFFYSETRYIRVFIRESGKYLVVDRSTFDFQPGVLVTDGLQPSKMKNGVFTEEEFSTFIREYFFIPS